MTARRAELLALVVPVLGCALLVALALVDEGAFRMLVHEDSVLEWAEVGVYVAAVIFAVEVARRTHGVVRFAYAGLTVCALLAIGEEVSWGQRVFGIGTPHRVAAANRQEELNLHNVVGADSATRYALFGAALYGVIAPLVLRPGPLVPPRALVPVFAVTAAYFGIRFAFFPRPTYMQAKFSEWPELCFAAGVALAAYSTLVRLRARNE